MLSRISKIYTNIPFNIVRNISNLRKNLQGSIDERLSQNIEPKILNYNEVKELCENIKNPQENEKEFLMYQFENRISPGVDDTSHLKASFLNSVCIGETNCDLIDKRVFIS